MNNMPAATTPSLSDPSPDSGGVVEAPGADDLPRHEVEGGRKRVNRACDKCSNSRTRCDGKFPCQHCTNYGFSCTYDREQKPRGRGSSKRMRIENLSSATSRLQTASRQAPSSTESITPSNLSLENSGEFHMREERHQTYSAQNGRQQDSSTAQPAVTTQTRRVPPIGNSSEIYNPRPEHHQFHDYLQMQHQDIASAPNYQTLYFDETNSSNFAHLDYYGASISGMPAGFYSSISPPVNQANDTDARRFSATPMDRSRIRPMSRIGFVVPGTPQFRPPTAFGKSPSAESPGIQGCRYPVLTPLLPHINSIISTKIACDLLDLYFAEPSSSLFESASPYVLTHIFRKKSFLHPLKPRVTSPALVAAMIWATAQTSDSAIFKTSPISRSRICDRLFAICLRLLNPLLHETPRAVSEKLSIPERSHNGNSGDGMQVIGTLDDVLTLTLIGIVVSGGDFKHDCRKWWRASWALAKELKLSQEIDESSSDTVRNPGSPYGSSAQDGSAYSLDSGEMSEEEKEERRRTWWLLYIADRHLALSFNAALNIQEAECHLYQPLDDATWQDFDSELPKERYFGPSTTCTGVGLFEFFLPLMVILGDIVDIHHRKYHPRFGALENMAAIAQVETLLEAYEQSLEALIQSPASSSNLHPNSNFQSQRLSSLNSQFNLPLSPTSPLPQSPSTEARKKIVVAYGTYILHVMHILLHGKWDPISMLDDLDHWTTSPSFLKCASHSVTAAEAVSQILNFDPELSFMPYLFGIYLMQGSFILLLFADKMQIEANPTVRQACETMIRAHEVCVATLNTEYQRNFRKVLRSALYDARGIVAIDTEDQRIKRREFLSLYRWANNGVGLAL